MRPLGPARQGTGRCRGHGRSRSPRRPITFRRPWEWTAASCHGKSSSPSCRARSRRSRASGTRSSSRTTTSAPRCRTSPISSATRSACRARRPRPTPTSSSSAACTSWPRRPPILSPTKTVLLPDLAAGCSLASTIDAEQLRAWKAEHPGAVVVSYVNTTAEVKAESDYCCTSGNAVEVVNSIPADKEILFLPRHVPRRARAARDRAREHPRVDGRVPRARRHRSRRTSALQRAPAPGGGVPDPSRVRLLDERARGDVRRRRRSATAYRSCRPKG